MLTDNPELESEDAELDALDRAVNSMLGLEEDDDEEDQDESPKVVAEDTDEPESDEEDEESEDPKPEPKKRKLKSGDEVTDEELENGYLRQADYTRKTMAAAEERRALEEKAAEVAAEREKYSVLLDRLGKQTVSVLGEEPDWAEMEARNPAEFAIEHAKWERGLRRLQVIEAEQNKIQQQRAVEQQAKFNTYLGQEQQKLLSAIPEWSDTAKRDSELKELREYGLKKGFTEQELDGIYDHRAVVLLREAMILDRAKARAATKTTKVKPSTKTLKPGAAAPESKPTRSKMREARNAHRNKGSIESAAKVLEAMGF